MKKILSLFAGLAFMFGIAFLTAPAAQADDGELNGRMEVCNSSASVTSIGAYDGYGVQDWYYVIYEGDCQLDPDTGYTRGLWNGNNNIRVDVEHDITPDVDSYKIGHISYGYGPCHEDSENYASDPPNSYEDTGARYRNYGDGGCIGV